MNRRLYCILFSVWLVTTGPLACSKSTDSGNDSSKNVPQPAMLDEADPLVVKLIRESLTKAQKYPDDVSAVGKLAMVYHASGLSDLAEETYERAISLDNTNPRWWYHLSLIRASRDNVQGAYEAMNQVITLKPDYAPAHWRRGLWLLDDGLEEEAAVSFRKAIELEPQNPSGKIGLARVHLARGEYVQASALLEQVVQQYDKMDYAHQLLGIAYQNLYRHADAAEHLGRSDGILLDWPDEWQRELGEYKTGYAAMIKRADSLLEAGRTQDAINTLLQLKPYFPNNALLSAKLGEVYLRSSLYDAALKSLQEAIKQDDSYFPAHLHLASTYLNRNMPSRALEHVNRALQINSTQAYAHWLRSQVLLKFNPPLLNDALNSMFNAIKYGKNELRVREQVGLLQMTLNRWEDAIATYETILVKNPRHVEGWSCLAQAWAELGDLQKAIFCQNKAAEIDSANPLLRQATNRIREIQQGGG